MTKQKIKSIGSIEKNLYLLNNIDDRIKQKGEIIPSTPSQFCKWEEEVLNKIEDRDILLEFVPKEKQADFLHNFADVLFSFEQQAISKTRHEMDKDRKQEDEIQYQYARATAISEVVQWIITLDWTKYCFCEGDNLTIKVSRLTTAFKKKFGVK